MKKKKERLIKKNLENSGSSEPPLNTKIILGDCGGLELLLNVPQFSSFASSLNRRYFPNPTATAC
jgi:hypothetical protein